MPQDRTGLARRRDPSSVPTIGLRCAGTVIRLLLVLAPATLSAAFDPTPERQDEIVAAGIRRALPGAVGILAEVCAEPTFCSWRHDLLGRKTRDILIPIDTIHALAKKVGLTPKPQSPFMEAWNGATHASIEGRYREALSYADDAEKIVPGLIEVERLRIRFRDRLQEKS